MGNDDGDAAASLWDDAASLREAATPLWDVAAFFERGGGVKRRGIGLLRMRVRIIRFEEGGRLTPEEQITE